MQGDRSGEERDGTQSGIYTVAQEDHEDLGGWASATDLFDAEARDAFSEGSDWDDHEADLAGLHDGYADSGHEESFSEPRPRPRGRIRHLRGRPSLGARVGVAVVACGVIAALIGATVYRLHLGAPPAGAKVHAAAPQTPPVITLLSASGAETQSGSQGAVAPLPVTSAAAPSQYLAPDKPSAYELSLIAASGAPAKAIVVSRDSQTIHVYQDGQFIAGSYAITGRPQLPTPVGVYQIFLKEGPAVLYSPWPPSSPFYYTPEPVSYVMEFRAGGFLIHDAPWHHVWGPGMNDWHFDPGANEWQWGTHGCVTAPTPFIQWLYGWSPYGTTVIVY